MKNRARCNKCDMRHIMNEDDLTREERLQIARLAYSEMMILKNKFENNYNNFSFCWDGCIGFGEHLFNERELNEKQS